MGRSKAISDTALLEKLLVEVEDVGPGSLTFARGAKAVGLASATLVQRFGTRDAMVEATLMHAWDRLEAATIAADGEAPISPAGAITLLMRLMPSEAAGYNVTGGLLLLQEDLRNPALRSRGRAWGTYLAKALGKRLTDDVDSAQRLGWQMASIWQGALIWWGFTCGTDAEVGVEATLVDWCKSVSIRR